MTSEKDDPLLDACLEEVLGAQTPPDLSRRILNALEEQTSNNQSADKQNSAELDRLQVQLQESPLQSRIDRSSRSTLPASWKIWTIAASLFAVFCLSSWYFLNRPGDQSLADPSNIADNSTQPKEQNISKRPGQALSPDKTDRPGDKHRSAIVDNRPGNSIPNHPDPLPTKNLPSKNKPAPKSPSTQAIVQSPVPAKSPSQANSTPSPDSEIIAFINDSLAQSWQENDLKPSPKADDTEWCRRTYLRLVGRIPSVKELQRYLNDRPRGRQARLVNSLLNDDDYIEEYARNSTTIWTNLLIGRTGGSGPKSLANREGLQQYLRRSFHKNKPYDQIVFELISAVGTGQPGEEGYNGAANFLLASQSDRATLATSRISRIFLGKHLQCAQCHNHPFDQWAQDNFWQLNSFLRQMHVERDPTSGIARLLNRDFPGESGLVSRADIFFELPNGLTKVAYPVFLDGTQLPPSGIVASVDRRTELARFIAADDSISRTMVNRTWEHFLGYGFTRPVDDIGVHNPPSHPELIERLTQEFIASGHDIKKLTRWITLSNAFELSSKITSQNKADDPQLGVAPQFARYYSRQMEAEELYESLLLVSQTERPQGGFAKSEIAKHLWLGQFNRSMETDDGEETSTFNGSASQTLMIMNGSLMQKATSIENGGLLHGLAHSKMTPEEQIEHLFMSALSRKPKPNEIKLAKSLFKAHPKDSLAAMQDLWWALLNSNEFILDH